jgi:hypothetical protein
VAAAQGFFVRKSLAKGSKSQNTHVVGPPFTSKLNGSGLIVWHEFAVLSGERFPVRKYFAAAQAAANPEWQSVSETVLSITQRSLSKDPYWRAYLKFIFELSPVE